MAAQICSTPVRVALGAAFAVVGALSVQEASAQGLFGALFGGFSHNDRDSSYDRRQNTGRQEWGGREWGRRDENYGRHSPTAYAPASPTLDGRFPIPDFNGQPQRRRAEAAPRGSAGTTNCVRLCDGRYFPLPRTASGARLDPVKVCSALCPAAKTQVFTGSNMEHAVASDGTRYSDLDEAFTFREKIVSDCSCTGRGPGGLAQIDVESDPTLRAGDIVVTGQGAAVFRGAASFPYKTADFTPVGDYSRINAQLREKLSSLKINRTVSPVLPPQKIAATAADDAKTVRTRQRRRTVTIETSGARVHPPVQYQAWR